MDPPSEEHDKSHRPKLTKNTISFQTSIFQSLLWTSTNKPLDTTNAHFTSNLRQNQNENRQCQQLCLLAVAQFSRWVILDSIISDHTHVNHNSRANHHNLSPQTKHLWTLIGADNVVTFSQYLVLNLASFYCFTWSHFRKDFTIKRTIHIMKDLFNDLFR